MMQRLTDFWIHYTGGLINSLDAFRRERSALRTADDPPEDQRHQRFLGEAVDPGYFNVQQRLKWPSHFTGQKYLDNFDRADWQGVQPWLVAWSGLVQLKLRQLDIPTFIHSATRDQTEQAELVRRRVSNAPFPNSAHNRGAAVDLVHSRYAWELVRSEWDFLHHVGRETERALNASLPEKERRALEWGGDWSNPYDPAHWQLAGWKNLPVIQKSEPRRLTALQASRAL